MSPRREDFDLGDTEPRDAPDRRGTQSRSRRACSDRKGCCDHACLEREVRVTDRERPRVDAMQSAGRDPASNAARGQAAIEELPQRDDPVLHPSDGCDPRVGSLIGGVGCHDPRLHATAKRSVTKVSHLRFRRREQ